MSAREVTLVTKKVTFGGEFLHDLVDSASLLQNPEDLRKRFEEDGYLLLRGVISPDVVQKARETVIKHLFERGFCDLEGILNPDKSATDQGTIGGTQALCRTQELKRLLEGDEIKTIMETLLGGAVRTFDYKWLRAVSTDEFTGCHTDSVYMGRGTKKLVTCWIPFMDIVMEKGVLAVLKGSSSLPSFKPVRDTYGNMDVDRDDVGGSGWFTNDPLELLKWGGQWVSSDFKAGDIIVFTMNTFHASTVNTTNQVRITCDVRFQLASEPVDDRWVGENPPGHSKFNYRTDKSMYPLTMEEAKVRWGLA